MAIIYLGTNIINGKQYVGSTKNTLKQRLYDAPHGHIYLAFNERLTGGMSIMELHKAIRSFGENAFSWKILEEQDNKSFKSNKAMYDWLDKREKFYIAKYNTMTTGYNETTGGRKNYHRSDSNKRKTSETTKAAMAKLDTKVLCNPTKYMTEEEKITYRKKISERTKEAMSKMNTKEKCNPYKYMTEEQKQDYIKRCSESRKGKPAHNRGKKVINNGLYCKYVDKSELRYYLANNWVTGYIKHRKEDL